MYKKALNLSGLKNVLKLSMPAISAGIAGAMLGGGAGYLGSDILWRKPNKKQRILMTLAGAGLGTAGGVATLQTMQPNNKLSITDSAGDVSLGMRNIPTSLAGSKLSRLLFKLLSPLAKAMYGSSNTGSGLQDTLGFIVRQGKKAAPSMDSSGLNIAGNILTQGIAGVTAGAAARNGLLELSKNRVRLKDIKNLLKNIDMLVASGGVPVEGVNKSLNYIRNRGLLKNLLGLSLNLGYRIAGMIKSPKASDLVKGSLKVTAKHPKARALLATLAGIGTAVGAGQLYNTLTGSNRNYNEWLKSVLG